MTDKDREALALASAEHLKSGGDVITEAAFASGWQAARDHYAPKLTEAPAMKAAWYAFDQAARRDNAGWVTNEGDAIEAALRAAGVRFKEEA